MDIWIRSQDREELIKVNNIYITTCNGGWAIKSGDVLGKYRTQKRALEILDEIQNLLKGKLIIKVNRNLSSDDFKLLNKKFGTDWIVDNNVEITGHENANIIYELPEE